MRQDEQAHHVSVERLRLLASRVKKVYRAREDLVCIFQYLVQFEQEAPMTREQLVNHQQKRTSPSYEWLTSQAQRLRNLVVQLVYSIRQLLGAYKFFNESFVFADKDYLKYVANEMTDLQALFGLYKVTLN